MDLNYTNEQINEFLNWTFPGLTMFYRDCNLPNITISKYESGQIIRSNIFVDVSDFAGKLAKNCRFMIATNKAAPLFEINPDTLKWKLHTINVNSFFKVLDIYKKNGKTQILLLHIPAKGINFFKNSIVVNINEENFTQKIIEFSRQSLDNKMKLEIIPELEENEWCDRTEYPIGLDSHNHFFPLETKNELSTVALNLSNFIFECTKDTHLNIT